MLRGEFVPSGAGSGGFASRDGRRRLRLVARPPGIRDLHAAFLRAAQEIARTPDLRLAMLAVWMPKPADGRIRREWDATMAVLKPAIARRMGLAVVRKDRCLALGRDRDIARIGEALRVRLAGVDETARDARTGPTESFFEIFKVLLHYWLLGEGPVPVGCLMRESGSSYPTVAAALKRLGEAREIVRRSNRSVELAGFPSRTWAEVLALSASLRRSRSWADRSGRPPDPASLLRRLATLAPDAVAVGGVVAARGWDPRFDLHGLPRLDVLVHAPGKAPDLGFVARLDPALVPAEPGDPGAVLAVHPIARAESFFVRGTKGRLPRADPVETLLDLHELRLVEQAGRLVETLRKAGRS